MNNDLIAKLYEEQKKLESLLKQNMNSIMRIQKKCNHEHVFKGDNEFQQEVCPDCGVIIIYCG